MNADLTIYAQPFKLIFSDKDGSLRRETSRGASSPTEMSIKSQPYVDTKTNRPGVRTVLRFDYSKPGTDGLPLTGAAYLVVARPTDAEFDNGDTLAMLDMIAQCLNAPANATLALSEEIFINGEQ